MRDIFPNPPPSNVGSCDRMDLFPKDLKPWLSFSITVIVQSIYGNLKNRLMRNLLSVIPQARKAS